MNNNGAFDVKTLLLYNSNPSNQLNLFRIWSIQFLLRSNNFGYSQITGSHIGTQSSLTATRTFQNNIMFLEIILKYILSYVIYFLKVGKYFELLRKEMMI